jgi:hypothetical protein
VALVDECLSRPRRRVNNQEKFTLPIFSIRVFGPVFGLGEPNSVPPNANAPLVDSSLVPSGAMY